MAISNLITLPEYAKGFALEDIRRTVIEMFTKYSDIFEVMPFESLRGSKYTGYREAALPTPVFRAINEASSSGHGTISPFDEATYIVDHDIDVDRAIQDRHGPERRNYEERMGITAFARLWVDTFVKGDQSTNPRVFNGLNVRARKFGRLYHNSTASGGAALSLANLDQVYNNVSKKSGTTYLFVPFISIPLWIQAARTTSLTGFVMQTWDQVGMPKMSYAGNRILFGYPKDDQVPVLQFNEVGNGGGSAVTGSVYWLTLGEGMLRGIQVRPLTPEDVGMLQDRKTFRTHIAWDIGMVDEHKYCLARLDSFTNAPIVA
jgi:major capsid protein gp7